MWAGPYLIRGIKVEVKEREITFLIPRVSLIFSEAFLNIFFLVFLVFNLIIKLLYSESKLSLCNSINWLSGSAKRKEPPVLEFSGAEDPTGEEVNTNEATNKFDGSDDFGIWRRKVKALLSQQNILKAIEGPDKLPDALTDEQKDDMLEMALGTIILNLFDNVLREVNDESTAFDVWKKLESSYLTKSLTNKIYLKEHMFSFKMDPSKGLGQNLDEFKRMTIELANEGEKEKLSDDNEAIILLNSLLDSFRDVKAAIKYGRSSLSLEECISALKSKDLELKIEKKDHGKNLFAKGKPSVKNSNPNNKNKSISKTSNNRSQSRGSTKRKPIWLADGENTRVVFGGGWPPVRIRASFSISSAEKRLMKHMVVVFGGGGSWWSDLGISDVEYVDGFDSVDGGVIDDYALGLILLMMVMKFLNFWVTFILTMVMS
ncbi:hypothetical protein EZV62_002312 [Acer yangbiense]|uniref:Retrotransposon Copia-like N-terminal domain-containing protein n=1 Tax=Acer yangbiense TaxID=1000413 RepID=A0A5C7IWX9_9ROSI|nr:hypothetical protein EZV62_002312 [Acer yangbiense]